MHALHAPYGEYHNTPRDAFQVTADAKRVRRYLEDHFLQHGYGPGIRDIVTDLVLPQQRVWDALHVLERAVQVMFVPGTQNLVKVPPFSYVPTRHRAVVDDGRSWHIGCAGEACAIHGLFPGQTVTLTSLCPDCWTDIEITIRDGVVTGMKPETAVIHMGMHPRDFPAEWNETCDSFNFFASAEHVRTWEAALPHKRGVRISVDSMIKLVEGVSSTRYWNYDRGSDSPGTPEGVVSKLTTMGVDVSAWQ